MNGLFSQMTLRTSDDFENGTAHANVSMASYEEVCRSCGKVWHSAGRMVPTRTMQNGADYNDFPTDSLLYNLTGDTEEKTNESEENLMHCAHRASILRSKIDARLGGRLAVIKRVYIIFLGSS